MATPRHEPRASRRSSQWSSQHARAVPMAAAPAPRCLRGSGARFHTDVRVPAAPSSKPGKHKTPPPATLMVQRGRRRVVRRTAPGAYSPPPRGRTITGSSLAGPYPPLNVLSRASGLCRPSLETRFTDRSHPGLRVTCLLDWTTSSGYRSRSDPETPSPWSPVHGTAVAHGCHTTSTTSAGVATSSASCLRVDVQE